MLSKLRTLAVLWMDLDTADLSSFMDGFGPSEDDMIKTADLGSSMDYFSLGRKTIQNSFVIVLYFFVAFLFHFKVHIDATCTQSKNVSPATLGRCFQVPDINVIHPNNFHTLSFF